jgi:hypothetical protein
MPAARRYGRAADEQVRIERQVKQILTSYGAPPRFNHFYMNFGKKVVQLRRNYKGPELAREVCIQYERWLRRGLEAEILNTIVTTYTSVWCMAPELPPGIIVMWNGLLVNVPAGWEICDGGDGRPDLRHKFIRGAGAGQDPGDTGGSETHTHLVSGSTVVADINHRHSVYLTTYLPDKIHADASGCDCYAANCNHVHCVIGYTGYTNPAHAHNVSISSASCSTLPTYYELIFIIKV